MAATTPPAMAPMWLLTLLPGPPAPGVTVVGGMPLVMNYNVSYNYSYFKSDNDVISYRLLLEWCLIVGQFQ